MREGLCGEPLLTSDVARSTRDEVEGCDGSVDIIKLDAEGNDRWLVMVAAHRDVGMVCWYMRRLTS